MQVFSVTKDQVLLDKMEFADNVHRFLDADPLVFVVPSELTKKFEDAYASRRFCKVLNENEVLNASLENIEQWDVFGFPDRAGWYFQQLLKLAIALNPIAEPRYVVWDSDTVPYRHIDFFDAEGRLMFTEGPEFHIPYFATNHRLLGIDRCRDGVFFSAVSQHMPVDREIMRSLLARVGESRGGDWVSAIREVISDGRRNRSLFSEYELFADWVRTEYQDLFHLRRLKWSRNGNLFTPMQRELAGKTMYFVAFETWHNRNLIDDVQKARLQIEVESFVPQSNDSVIQQLQAPELVRSRNAPCPCNSGKRFKHCCGKLA